MAANTGSSLEAARGVLLQHMSSKKTAASKASKSGASLDAASTTLQQALDHQRGLSTACAELQALVAKDPHNKALRVILASFISNTTPLDGLLRSAKQSIAYTQARPSLRAKEVFAIPELLEMILLELPIFDILNMYQVQKSMKLAIDQSSKVKRKLALIGASEDGFVRLPFLYSEVGQATLGFSCTLSPAWTRPLPSQYYFCGTGRSPNSEDQQQDPVSQDIYATFDLLISDTGKVPTIGARCRSQFICQPPIFEVEATAVCCQDHRQGFRGAMAYTSFMPNNFSMAGQSTIYNPAGLQVGDIADAAQKITKEHANCPNADVHNIDRAGVVCPEVRFVARIHLEKNDPIYKKGERHRQAYMCMEEARKKDEAVLARYSRAKGDAYVLRQPLISLKDFLAAEYGEDFRLERHKAYYQDLSDSFTQDALFPVLSYFARD